MQDSKIEWTDHTFNPWEGCTKVSPGCANCYAETRNARWAGGKAPNWGKGAPRRRTSASLWKQPLKWNRESTERAEEAKRNCGNYYVMERGWLPYRRPRVFCASLADWLDDEVPIEWLADLLELIRLTPNLDWLLLTKRPENWRRRLGEVDVYLAHTLPNGSSSFPGDRLDWIREWYDGHFPENIWIGTTVEDQTRAEERIPAVHKIPAKVRFLSCEPLLGPVDLLDLFFNKDRFGISFGIDWVIVGGESGLKARPMHSKWAQSLRDQCQSARVPFFFKQWGEWLPLDDTSHSGEVFAGDGSDREMGIDFKGRYSANGEFCHVGKKVAGRLLDQVEHSAFPELETQKP